MAKKSAAAYNDDYDYEEEEKEGDGTGGKGDLMPTALIGRNQGYGLTLKKQVPR